MNKIARTLMIACLSAAAAMAQGNIVITGHDDDFHWSGDGIGAAPGLQMAAFYRFARNGSTLPVLAFDHGTQMTGALTALGIPFTRVDPDVSANVTDALFNHSTYSAFAVASDNSCGGCDNDSTGEGNIASHSAAIGAFLNAGGGIVAYAGANNTSYYAFIPQTATSVGGAPSTGYSQTAEGATLNIPAVNGDPTHNLFHNPGSGGESSAFQIVELNSIGNETIGPPAATTLVCVSCNVSGTTITTGGGGPAATPAPASLWLIALGLMATISFYAFSRKSARSL